VDFLIDRIVNAGVGLIEFVREELELRGYLLNDRKQDHLMVDALVAAGKIKRHAAMVAPAPQDTPQLPP